MIVMRTVVLSALVTTLLAAPSVFAQKLDLKFDALAAKASKKVEVDLDTRLLHLAARLSGDQDLNNLLSGVKAVHVRNYEFDKSGAYSQKDLDSLRNQVTAQPRWSQILSTKEDDESVEIYIAAEADKVSGCLIVSAEESELSIIYLEGTMTLAQMKRLINEDTRHDLAALFDNH
jgi:hypothetical protein